MKHVRKALTLATLSIVVLAGAHQGHHPQNTPPTAAETTAFAKINEQYLRDVKPIFEKKCFDCHSSQTHFPGYYKIPGVKQFIDYDIREAKEHIDMDPGFPFKSHASPLEDLKAIEEDISENDMPPWSYKIMHSGSDLTGDEKALVLQWTKTGQELLKEKPQ